MTDLHRLPAEREPAFWEGQRHINRAPMCCSDGIEDGPPIIKPSRFGWMIWPAMGVFLGFIVVIGIASI